MAISNGGNFWTATPAKDPKRAFRFKVELGNSGVLWYAKTAQRPTLSIGETSHNFMNHTYYWPGKADWSEVAISFIDPVDPDLGSDLMAAIAASGYAIPKGTSGKLTSMSKQSVMKTLGGNTDAAGANSIRIHMIDENGDQLETWSLIHAWIKSIDFSDLDYGSDEMSEVTVTFRYDWAEFLDKNETKVFGTLA